MPDISLPIRLGEDFIESGHATCIGSQPEQPDQLRRIYPVFIGPDRRNDMAGKSPGLNKHPPSYMDPYQDHNKVLESKTNNVRSDASRLLVDLFPTGWFAGGTIHWESKDAVDWDWICMPSSI